MKLALIYIYIYIYIYPQVPHRQTRELFRGLEQLRPCYDVCHVSVPISSWNSTFLFHIVPASSHGIRFVITGLLRGRRIVLFSHRRAPWTRPKGAQFNLRCSIFHLHCNYSWGLATQECHFVCGAHHFGRASWYVVLPSCTRLVWNPPLERYPFKSRIHLHRFHVAYLGTAFDMFLQSCGSKCVRETEAIVLGYFCG